MSKNTSITIGEHFEAFIGRQVADGRYGTASEVIRAGLRMLEEEDTKLAALRSALEQGERSGLVEDYSLAEVLAEVRRGKR